MHVASRVAGDIGVARGVQRDAVGLGTGLESGAAEIGAVDERGAVGAELADECAIARGGRLIGARGGRHAAAALAGDVGMAERIDRDRVGGGALEIGRIK
jgi:hypothetical protein